MVIKLKSKYSLDLTIYLSFGFYIYLGADDEDLQIKVYSNTRGSF